jgi:hypothetical protein
LPNGLGVALLRRERGDVLGRRKAPTSPRRDVDLYIHVDDLEERFAVVAPKVELVEGLHATDYGMQEFIIKDLNGFWITFGQPLKKG